jgi:hypothetical protein
VISLYGNTFPSFFFSFYTSLDHPASVSKVLEGKDLKREILLRSFIFKIIQSEFRYLISMTHLIMLLVHDVICLLLIS